MAIKKKKLGKNRLDKYYHLAKEQGYRARSAFKLIQLNKKYNFLEKARVLIDLCAAPGGWLQVASKYMPMSRLVIGIDLVPIKPIPNVITLQNDITTEKCRVDIKKELKNWKVDVVLNDGAPNVGTAWLQDAFTQSELVLSALKLASEFLIEGGCFVTKVFRSKDYNSLMWVFQQLFKRVEATKPASSRNVSAEIFVVCREFLAPKKIDPKFFDPKYVFEDMELGSGNKAINIFQPEKRKRFREGYEDGVTLLFKKISAIDYLSSSVDPAIILGTYNEISFEDDASMGLEVSEEIKNCCKDLKLLGKSEFKLLLKWRTAFRKKTEKKADEDKPKEAEVKADIESEEEIENEVQKLKKTEKKRKQKDLLKKAKSKLKMQMNGDMETMQEDELFSFNKFILDTSIPEEFSDDEMVEQPSENRIDYVSDEDERDKILEEDLDKVYEQYLERVQMRDPKFVVKRKREQEMLNEETFTGFNESENNDNDSEDESSIISSEKGANRADNWFKQSIFLDEESSVQKTSGIKEAVEHEEIDTKELPEEVDEDSDLKESFLNPQGISLALKLIDAKNKKDIIDDSFNRYSFNDPELPRWFLEDEQRHNKPRKPVTKEAVKQYKEKLKTLNERPIKKVMEAKARKKMKASRKIEKIKKKASEIVENEDLTDRQKLENVQKIMRNASKKVENKVKLVVARGGNKGKKGRPNGVKGRYKMVDPRMKKELRASKKSKK